MPVSRHMESPLNLLLYVASANGHKTVAELLLEKGADVDR